MTLICTFDFLDFPGPGPFEALASGCVFIQPKFNPPHDRHNTVSIMFHIDWESVYSVVSFPDPIPHWGTCTCKCMVLGHHVSVCRTAELTKLESVPTQSLA